MKVHTSFEEQKFFAPKGVLKAATYRYEYSYVNTFFSTGAQFLPFFHAPKKN